MALALAHCPERTFGSVLISRSLGLQTLDLPFCPFNPEVSLFKNSRIKLECVTYGLEIASGPFNYCLETMLSGAFSWDDVPSEALKRLVDDEELKMDLSKKSKKPISFLMASQEIGLAMKYFLYSNPDTGPRRPFPYVLPVCIVSSSPGVSSSIHPLESIF